MIHLMISLKLLLYQVNFLAVIEKKLEKWIYEISYNAVFNAELSVFLKIFLSENIK